MANTMAKYSTHRYRRRLTHWFSMPAAAVVLALGMMGGGGGMFLGQVSAASGTSVVTDPLVPLDAAMLKSNLRHWNTDYAVMFYAPWCKHCKEAFLPLWQDVAMQLAEEDPKGKKKLVMGKFNCEQDKAATAFCEEIKLMYYPTFVFFGSGKFHDHDPISGVVLGPRPTQHDSSAKFPSSAMVYFEIMWDWVMTMHFVSGSNRAMDKLKFFGGSKQSSEERLVGEIEALERQNQQLQNALAGGSGEAVIDEDQGLPYGYGDPYAELWEVDYDAEFEPIMSCVIDMAVQYCDAEGVKAIDPWCSTLESCIVTEFAGDECWPSSCPFIPEGCKICSYCLTPELVESYMKLYLQEIEETDQAGAGAATANGDLGHFETWPEDAVAAGSGAEQAGGVSGLPPFLGGRPAASKGGVDRTADERGETVTA